MLPAEIKRPKNSIDNLLRGYAPDAPEEPLKQETAPSQYQTLLDRLEEYLDLRATDDDQNPDAPDPDELLETLDDVLKPDEINQFLQTTTSLEQHEMYLQYAGTFINRLIQNSYDARHNDFTLNLDNLREIDNIGENLKGTKANRIKITITGKTGNRCGYEAEHCTFNTEKTGDYYGHRAKNCIFNTEKTGDGYGIEAINCTFNAKKTGDFCGGLAKNSTFNTTKTGNNYGQVAQNCTFNTEKTGVECGYRAENCTFNTQKTGNNCGYKAKKSRFKTTNPQTLQQMLKQVPKGNRIIFIDAEGNEKVKREYK